MMYENSPKEINLKSPEICEYGDIYARLIARNIFTEEDEKLWLVAAYRLLMFAISFVNHRDRDNVCKTTMPDIAKYLAERDNNYISADIDDFARKYPYETKHIEAGRLWDRLPDATKKAIKDIVVLRLNQELAA